jgi:hypothetical protein
MLPNFTVVICGAILTVLMLAVAGSGLIDPETRTRIGAMPEVGRPMMQRMITEPAARFAALEASRRAEELMRLRDLAPAVAVPPPAPEHDESAQPGDEAAAPAASTQAPPAIAETVITETVPAAAAEETPPAGAESAPAPAAVVEAPPAVEAPAAVAEALPPPVAERAQVQDTTGAQTPDASNLAEPTVEPPMAPPRQAAVAPSSEVPSSGAPSSEASSSEPAATAAQSEPPVEPSAPALQQLALADPDAVPDPEPPAKLAARTGEPEEAAPVRHVVPHFLVRLMARLPRVVPPHARASAPRLAPALPRMASVRHVHARARAEAGKQVVAPKKPVRHVVRAVHRAQRASVAPGTVPYPSYSGTSGGQYR